MNPDLKYETTAAVKIKIPRCYDSHLHLVPTGELGSSLDLKSVKTKTDVFNLAIRPEHFRGDWIVGWGFDDLSWQDQQPLNRDLLDEKFPANPVSLSRKDGHVVWVNTKALQKLQLLKPKTQWPDDLQPFVEFGRDGLPTGVLKDRALDLILMSIPHPSELQTRHFLEVAFKLLLRQGFTHVREMMGTERSWNVLLQMDQNKDLKNYVEVNFHCPHLDQLSKTLDLIERARQSASKKVRQGAVKVFLDGALGSSGAFLTEHYVDQNHSGTLLWTEKQIRNVLKESWSRGIEVSLHTLGDGASLVALEAAQELYRENIVGRLHLEHVEIFSDRALQLCRNLDVTCHIQPSHFLTDQQWLRKRLGDRISKCFPWYRLEKQGVPFFFGSDTPIEPPDLQLTRNALIQSAQFGIPGLLMDWTFPHSHPDPSWGSDCWTEINPTGQVLNVFVDKEPLQF